MEHTLWKSERARKASNKETAPRCHRVTRQVGHQKATTEPSQQGLQLLSHLRLPNGHPSANISPGRGWCVESSRDMALQALWGVDQPCGWNRVIRVAPHYRWSRHTHTHPHQLWYKTTTQKDAGNPCAQSAQKF